MSRTKKIFMLLLPVLIVIGAAGVSAVLVMAKPEPEKKPAVEIARNIRVVTAHEGRVSLAVKTQGTVEAKQRIDLVPQVSGLVIYVPENFVTGGEFKKGDVILRLDPRDYENAVTTAEARVAESRQVLVREKAEAALALSEWEILGQGEASDLTLRKPQLADAEAKLKAAEASLRSAQLDLERTVIRAPFDGLLSSKNIDLGQYLSPGTKIGEFYSSDIVEIRLPMSSRDLAQFDFAGLRNGTTQLDVTLTGRFADEERHWKGTIVRTEGIIDSKTRIMYVVAQLRGNELLSVEDKLPLSIGQFVTADVQGRTFDKVFQLPRDILRQGNKVLVVDKDNKLRSRIVKVLEANRDFVVISDGLEEGDVLCKTQLGLDVDGLLVKYEQTEGLSS